MHLFDCKDECHKKLREHATQIKYSSEDMIEEPKARAGLLLPRNLHPATAQKFVKFFYNSYQEKIYNWAREEGLQITKDVFRGPEIILLKVNGTLYVRKDRVLLSIVIPKPSEHQFADEEEHGYRGPAAKTSLVSQAEASSTNAGPLPPASITITSDSDSSLRLTLTGLDIGDVIILEAGERLLVDGGSNSKAQSICLVSTTHITSSGVAGEGGWKEEEGNEPAI
ncbi:hypothetical protein FOPG_18838 [Fusarium oxysporum f. sp. conglutinans race 2 54008]|uniref:Uncharacterized protein n=1 Tax=Fusarium oxysporum f. sp. conglutinans race 2 54008 TaxID=1089457 RepID=X0GYN3_FUSOX|nr:hypothetical protein FOPG_18838 [Fusarium oxysporum f. sp. conglutinans race 2 54008]KAG6988706.1 hypothetical protein FocnCong_v001809 [Fusarium oxysporum f. sp. conglutinans]KAG6989490.1 hypothetical protein FocnCong_v020951 [Fusarium oxysporum f. sp. conglutinans]KAK2122127.1 hypothetical protein NOF04DRAFT_1226161 [Fusarium oxysporum II5]